MPDTPVALRAETHARYRGPTSGPMPLDGALHVAPYEWCATQFVTPGKVVVDCGCGEGFGARILARSGAVVTAIDLLDRSPFASEGPDRDIRYLTADISSSGLSAHAGKPFDVVTSHEVIEHVIDYFGFLRNVVDLLADDGVAVIGTPNRMITYEFYPRRAHMDESHVQEFTPIALLETMRLFFEEVALYAELVPRFSIRDAFASPEPQVPNPSLRSKAKEWVPPKVIELLRRRVSPRRVVSAEVAEDLWTTDDVEIRAFRPDVQFSAFRLIAVARRPLRERCWEHL